MKKEKELYVTNDYYNMVVKLQDDLRDAQGCLKAVRYENEMLKNKETLLVEVAGVILNIREITRIDKVYIRMLKNGYIDTNIIDSYSISIWSGSSFMACLQFKKLEELEEKRSKIIDLLNVKTL